MSVAVKEPHTSTNGVVKIPRRGLVKFQFGDDEPVIELDVIEVYDSWRTMDWAQRDAEGVLPKELQDEHAKSTHDFVQAVINDAYARCASDAPVIQLTRSESEFFLFSLQEEARKLREFYVKKKDELSSVPPNTDGTEIRFSQ